MDRLLNAMKGQAAALDRGQGQPRFGIVTSVDLASYAARVVLQPEGVLTGWLPILSPWVGGGWGFVAFPSPGDQVLVIPQEGDAEHGVIIGCSYSASNRPPLAQPGELRIVHSSGSSLVFANDGSVRVEGNLKVTGEISESHGSMSQLRGHYNQHGHPGSTTTHPIPQD
jgi:hypothetical protein